MGVLHPHTRGVGPVGRRVSAEDAYAYGKFARTVLGTKVEQERTMRLLAAAGIELGRD